MPSLLPADFPRLDALGVDAAVLAFALVVSVGTSIVCGLLPALRARRLNLVEALSEDGTAPVGAGVRTRTARARMLVMAGQVTIACVLLVGASLLGRSFFALINADRGFDPTDVLSARVSMPATMYPSPERRFAIIEQVLGRLAAMPGVADAAFTSELPLTPWRVHERVQSEIDRPPTAGSSGSRRRRGSSARGISPTLRIRAIAGRVFSDIDTETSEPVVVVNQAFARRYLGDSPLGAKVPMAGYAPPRQRAGRVDGHRRRGRRALRDGGGQRSQPEMFYSHRQMWRSASRCRRSRC